MSRHDALVTLKQLLDFAVEARALIEGRQRSDLGERLVFTRAAERLVTLIGEAAARLPPELRAAEAHVPWIDIIGTRNRIMHGYDVIDYYFPIIAGHAAIRSQLPNRMQIAL